MALLHWNNSPIGANISGYGMPWGGGGADASDHQFTPVPSAGTLRNLRVRARVPGSSGTATYTIFVNNVATSLAVTVSAASNPHVGSNTTDTVSVVAGDLISLMLDSSGTNGQDDVSIVVEFEMT